MPPLIKFQKQMLLQLAVQSCLARGNISKLKSKEQGDPRALGGIREGPYFLTRNCFLTRFFNTYLRRFFFIHFNTKFFNPKNEIFKKNLVLKSKNCVKKFKKCAKKFRGKK